MNRDGFLHDLTHTGFTVQHNAFDTDMVNELNLFAESLPPERGHAKDKTWVGWQECQSLENPKTDVDWAYYWTHQVDHPIISQMKETLGQYADAAFGEHNWNWHVQDFIVLHPGMNFYRPHIDTPYRFPEFRYNEELLGLQFMVMMCDFNEHNGATGYVPGTHKYTFDPKSIQGDNSWNTFFADNYQQYTAGAGSFVSWHPRLLHSTMPNKSNEIRRALLLHASEKKTQRKLHVIDPQINNTIRTT
jgi:ectoine hydroxylase-related dioxygenase (phytanoyl-CoA dioxygenase family)|tara:strand:- start:2824 stop:3561 length:738 start_codon:yes stop_codon:yes gene_type:complete